MKLKEILGFPLDTPAIPKESMGTPPCGSSGNCVWVPGGLLGVLGSFGDFPGDLLGVGTRTQKQESGSKTRESGSRKREFGSGKGAEGRA